MKKNAWKKKIKQACEEAGTYEDFFDLAIEQLSLIMETRDEALKLFAGQKFKTERRESGGGAHEQRRRDEYRQESGSASNKRMQSAGAGILERSGSHAEGV